MLRALLRGSTSAAALMVAGPASAWPHHGAVPPQIITETFGAETLGGYGGTAFGYPGGIASISNLRNGSGIASTDFTVDLNNDIVPAGTYGTAGPSFNGPYTLTVTPVSGAPFAAQLNITPSAATWKSHYNFAHNPDTTSSFQLLTYLNSPSILHGGEVLIGRSGSGTTGLTPALNPLAQGGSGRYIVFPPATGWTTNAANPVYVQCEYSTPGNDTNGNPNDGGACQIGSLIISANNSGDVQIPLKLRYVTLYTDQPTGLTNQLAYNSGLAWGVSCDHCRFELGPDVSAAEIRIAGIIGFAPHLGSVTHSHFVREFVAVSAGYANSPTAGTVITDNIFEGTETDSIDLMNGTSGYDIERNFHFNWQTGGANPVIGDVFTIGAKTYTFVSSITAAGNADGNILLAGNAAVTFQNILCSINAGGSGCTAGVNYPAAEVADANVTASVGPGYTAIVNYSVQVTARTAGAAGNSITVGAANTVVSGNRMTSAFWQNVSAGGTSISTLFGGSDTGPAAAVGYLNLQPDHGDTVQLLLSSSTSLPAMTHSYDISVRNVGIPNGDSQQFQFGNYPKNINNAVFQNNISFQTVANQMYIGGFNSPTVSFNTNIADVASNAYAPTDPSYDSVNNLPWYGYISDGFNGVPNTGNTGGAWSHNLSNGFDISEQTSATATPNPNEAVNVVNANFATQASAFAIYATFLPNLPSGYQTTLSNRAAVISALAPSTGATFSASITNGGTTLTVLSGSVPTVNSVINGPGIPSGDVVSAVAGSNVTLRTPATASEVAQTYATGAMNPDGTYNGALFPKDNAGAVAWNDGSVFNPAATHTQAN